VRDGINLARRGIPTVCLLTNKFSDQGDFTARAAGMPGIPRVILPHPIAGASTEKMHKVIADIMDLVTGLLEESSK
jgi:hypothetical protein